MTVHPHDMHALTDRADWLYRRYLYERAEARNCIRRARKNFRWGWIGYAHDNLRVARRHLRMAKHFRSKMA